MSERITVGRVGRPHGVHGCFFVEAASEAPERFALGASVWVDGAPATIVESKRAGGGRPVIRFERAVPRGATLEVPRAELPPADEGGYYVFQLVGLQVEEESGRLLGRVADVLPGVANDSLELDSRLVLPLIEDCIREIDLGGGRIVVARGYADPE